MQTFLPYADFANSMKALDQKRLGKQRVETFQILQALTGKRVTNTWHDESVPGKMRTVYYDADDRRIGARSRIPGVEYTAVLEQVFKRVDHPQSEWQIEDFDAKGWKHHPAALMWAEHLEALVKYQQYTVLEWTRRKYRDTCLPKTLFLMNAVLGHPATLWPDMPPWLGDLEFHRSHQSNLIRKLPDFYGPQFPGVPDDLPYKWPTEVPA